MGANTDYVRYSGGILKPRNVGNRTLLTAVGSPAANGSINLVVPAAYFYVTKVTFIIQPSLVSASAGPLGLLVYEGTNTASTLIAFTEALIPMVAPTGFVGPGACSIAIDCDYNSQTATSPLVFAWVIPGALTNSFWCLVSYGLLSETY